MKRNLFFFAALVILPGVIGYPMAYVLSVIFEYSLHEAFARSSNYVGGTVVGAWMWSGKP